MRNYRKRQIMKIRKICNKKIMEFLRRNRDIEKYSKMLENETFHATKRVFEGTFCSIMNNCVR